jgi:hypothetical protein
VKGSFVSLGEPSLAERARNSQILREDFNIDFADKNIKALIDFLKTPLDLNILNDSKDNATKYGTTIDGVF